MSRSSTKTLDNILWPRAVLTLRSMLHSRGFENVDEAPVWNAKAQKWWMTGTLTNTHSTEKPMAVKGIRRCYVLLMDTKGCVGKQNVEGIIQIFKKKIKTTTWNLGTAIFVHTSRTSSDGAFLLAKNNIEVFDVADLQYDVMKINNQHGILLDFKLVGINVPVDGPERHWLVTDPVARYFCLNAGDKVVWNSVSLCCPGVLVPWCAVVVTKPLN